MERTDVARWLSSPPLLYFSGVAWYTFRRHRCIVYGKIPLSLSGHMYLCAAAGAASGQTMHVI